jgi:hypothetical protein
MVSCTIPSSVSKIQGSGSLKIKIKKPNECKKIGKSFFTDDEESIDKAHTILIFIIAMVNQYEAH